MEFFSSILSGMITPITRSYRFSSRSRIPQTPTRLMLPILMLLRLFSTSEHNSESSSSISRISPQLLKLSTSRSFPATEQPSVFVSRTMSSLSSSVTSSSVSTSSISEIPMPAILPETISRKKTDTRLSLILQKRPSSNSQSGGPLNPSITQMSIQ